VLVSVSLLTSTALLLLSLVVSLRSSVQDGRLHKPAPAEHDFEARPVCILQ
jgi:hypothetical protein